MHKLIITLHSVFMRFEHWFDRRLGWFFTNGMKNAPERANALKDRPHAEELPTA